MKKLTNLIALVMLVNTNVLTLFTYAQEIPEDNTGIAENEETYLDFQQPSQDLLVNLYCQYNIQNQVLWQ